MSNEKETPKAEIPNAHLHRTINGLDENGEKQTTPEPEVKKERELPNQHLHNLHNSPGVDAEKVKPGIAFEKDKDGNVIDKKTTANPDEQLGEVPEELPTHLGGVKLETENPTEETK